MKKYRFKHDNEEEIKAYITNNKLKAQKSETGLYYLISKAGEGKHPTPDSNITIAYIGYLTNGDIFDQNDRLEINLSEVIPGWTEGIQYFKEGGEGILFIPAHLAYGIDDYGSIPGGSKRWRRTESGPCGPAYCRGIEWWPGGPGGAE